MSQAFFDIQYYKKKCHDHVENGRHPKEDQLNITKSVLVLDCRHIVSEKQDEVRADQQQVLVHDQHQVVEEVDHWGVCHAPTGHCQVEHGQEQDLKDDYSLHEGHYRSENQPS